MGIPIRGGRRRRRSYADYRPSNRHPRPRSDPFRVVFYLALIAGALWVYFNPDIVRGMLFSETGEVAVVLGPTPDREATSDPSAFAALAEEAYGQGDIESAIENYRRAADAAPNNVGYHFRVARLLLFRSALEYGETQESTLNEAIGAANNAILADPDSPLGYAILGKIKDWQGNPEEALNNINRALEIDPQFAIAHAYLAEALIDLDRWDQAQTSIEHALSLAPSDVDVRRDYAYVLEILGDYAGAAAQYEAALQLESQLPHLHMALGRIYRVNGRYDESLDQFFAVENQYPNNALVSYEIGKTYETYVGDPSAALEAYQLAVESDPDFGAPWVRLGTLYYAQGNYPQATLAFEQALALGLDSVDIYYQLGLAYASEGDCGKAIQPLEKARSLAGDDERIIDLVNTGLEVCSQPTATPDPDATPGRTPTPDSAGDG